MSSLVSMWSARSIYKSEKRNLYIIRLEGKVNFYV